MSLKDKVLLEKSPFWNTNANSFRVGKKYYTHHAQEIKNYLFNDDFVQICAFTRVYQ